LDEYVNLRRSIPAVVAALVVVTLLVTGPLTGVDATQQSATALGDGTATVSDVTVDTAALRVTPGRFGTDVAYLRIPDATIRVTEAVDRPRLVYRIVVEELGVSVTETTLVTGPSTYRLDPDHQGIAASAADGRQYNATVEVRVQSYSSDQTVFQENVTVEVER